MRRAPVAPRAAAGPRHRGRVIRFYSGEFEGGEFPLEDGHDLLLGRGEGCDIAFSDDLVSRRHARIVIADDHVHIEDAGSMNGIFVNGVRIPAAQLATGDRVLVGANLFRLQRTDRVQSVHEARAALRTMAQSHVGLPAGGLSGSLEEVPLADLLQLLATGKKTGILDVRSDRRKARLHLAAGRVVGAEFGGVEGVTAAKAVHRLLAWEQGRFDLRPEPPVAAEGHVPAVPELLMEGMRQLDELRALPGPLPDPEAIVHLRRRLAVPLRDLAPHELDVVETLLAPRQFEVLLALVPGSAATAAATLLSLVDRGVAAVAGTAEPA